MQKFKNGKFIFHILCIDDMLLTSSDVNLPLEKKFLYSSFDMNDLGEVEIHRDRRKRGIRTITKAYLENILKK